LQTPGWIVQLQKMEAHFQQQLAEEIYNYKHQLQKSIATIEELKRQLEMSNHNLRLPDRNKTYAVLIGCSRYQYQSESLGDIPAVENNLKDMFSVLTDEHYGSIQTDHCARLLNPDALQVARTLQDYASKAKDTFLVYYAGHGLLGNDGTFYLAAHGTDESHPQVSAIPYAAVVHETFLHHTNAPNRILILDCCFANRATEAFNEDGKSFFMGTDKAPDMPRGMQISGTCILAAAGSNEQAIAPEGTRYTVFSGALIELLREGIPGNLPYISPLMAYAEIRSRIPEGAPLPKQYLTDTADKLALVRNRAYAVPIRVGDSISIDSEGHTTIEPHRDFHDMIGEADQLKTQGKLDEANKIYEQAKQVSRIQWENATYDHAELLVKQGLLVEAEEAHRKAIEQGVGQSLGALAELLERQGRTEEAERYYRKAIDAGFVRYIRKLDDLLLQQGRSAEAETLYQQIIKEGYTDLWPDWAEFLAIQGRTDEAMDICLEAIRGGNPTTSYLRSTDAAYNLGVFYMRRNDIANGARFLQSAALAGDAEADQHLTEFFKKMRESHNSNTETDRYNKALLAYLLKEMSKAIQIMGKACSPSPPQFLTEFQEVLRLYFPEQQFPGLTN